MKKIIKIISALLLTLLVLTGCLILYVVCSPQPAVWLLRQNFHGEPEIQNAENYESIKETVDIYKDLSYPSKGGRNKFDVYLPKNPTGKLPTIVWVHGGAFVAGTKDGIENYAVMLANEGYAVVGADYEWAPEIEYPGQVRQIEECLKELENIQDTYHLNLDEIILFGDSAGAHIAAQAALLATNPEYEKAIGVTSAITESQLAGAVLFCGPYNVFEMLDTGNKAIDFFASRIGWALFGDKDWKNGDMLKTTTIKDYVTEEFPPVFISDGNSGSFESQGKELAEELKNQGSDVETLFFSKEEYGEVEHEYQFNIGDGADGSLCYEKVMEFLSRL